MVKPFDTNADPNLSYWAQRRHEQQRPVREPQAITGVVVPSIIGDNVVLEQDNGAAIRMIIPFSQWNDLVEQIGHRTPAEDKDCPP